MTGYIPPEKIEEIKARANIVEIVSEYVTLKKAGRNYIGLCPFHKEKKPSFSVNPEKQIFYCFGCGAGGNSISFIMQINDMAFPEAVRHLAGKLGVVIPEKKLSREEKRDATEREKLCRVNKVAKDYFSKNLTSARGLAAREYLEKRGVNEAVIETFSLGYAFDGWSYGKNFFKERGAPLELVHKAGLVVKRENAQGYYDRFRNRVMFPIENLSGDIVAFGGRIIVDGEPKYLNSPESPVYSKGRMLYGLNQTKTEIKKQDEVIVVEGYLDLLSLWAYGTKNVVATLGTALTKEQVEQIHRFTRNIVVIFDPDEAGRNAVERSLALFLEEEMRVRVVILPDGYDPDDFVRRFGGKALEEEIRRAPSMVDYYIDEVMGEERTLEGKRDALKRAISFIGNISDPIQRNLFVKRVAERMNVDEQVFKEEVKKYHSPRKRPPDRGRVPEKKTKHVDRVELSLINAIMEYPDRIPVVERERVFDYLVDEEILRLGKRIASAYHIGDVSDVADIISGLHDGYVKDKLLQLSMEETPYTEDVVDKVLNDTIIKIKLRWYSVKRKMLQKELMDAQKMGDVELCDRLVAEKGRLMQEEKLYKDKIGASSTA